MTTLIAITLAGCAIHAPQTDFSFIPTLEESVAKEFQKHDHWVERVLEQDYLNEEQENDLHIQQQDPLDTSLLGIPNLGIAALYDPLTNTLTLPTQRGQAPKAALETIDHELFHYVYDEMIESKGYEGPTREEIHTYLIKRRSDPEFTHIPKALELAVQGREQQRVLNLYVKAYEVMNTIFESGINHEWDKACLDSLSADEREFVETIDEKMLASLEEYRRAIKPLLEELEAIREKVAAAETAYVGYRENQAAIQALEQKIKEVERYRTFPNQLYADFIKVNEIATRKGYGPHEEQKEECTGESSLCRGIELYAQLLELQKEKNISPHVLKKNDVEKKILEYNLAIESSAVMDSTTGKLYETFEDDNELFARIVDSACSLYFGPVDDLYVPLTIEDTAFIGSMHFHGKPLFGKCVEKYEVGRAMKEQGISQEDLREQLEYATQFVWGGKTYRWPTARVEFIGEIPKANLGE